MALFNEVSGGSYVNVPTMIGAEVRNLSRDGRTISFEYRAYIYRYTTTWSTNTWALWVEGTQYNVKKQEVKSERDTKYYTPWRAATRTLSAEATSTTIDIGVNGKLYSPTTPAGTVTLTLSDFPAASAPSVSALTISNIGDKSASASFSVTNSNNSTIISNEIQFSTTNFGTVVKTISGTSGSVSGLDAGRTYYVRGKSVNGVGTTYTDTKSFTTYYINPGNPGTPILTYDQTQPIPKAKLKATWTEGSSGSNSIAGYRIRLFKNNVEIFMVDTTTSATYYTFNSFESLGFVPGDIVKVGIYAYSKDYNGNKHFNGGGEGFAQVFSETLTIVSDKFIYLSQNGGDFAKKKMYISVNGENFIEVKKEKFKIIS